MRTTKRPTLAPHALIGCWLHTFNEDDSLHYQGQILDVDGDVVLVQTYEWLDGCPSVIAAMPKAVIYSDRCCLYQTNALMQEAYARLARREWKR